MRFFCHPLYCLMIWSGIAGAQNIISFPVGESWQFPDARTLAMAGAGAVSNTSPASLMLNPAALAGNSSRIDLSLSAGTRNLEERRAFPVFNRFDDVSQLGIYVQNDHWFPKFQGGLLLGFDWQGVPLLKALAIGVFDELDQDFLYDEEVRENIFGDRVIAYNRIKFEGRLQRFAGGAAFQFAGVLNLGFQVGLLSGDLKQQRSVTFLREPEKNLQERATHSLDNTPVVASFGAIYEVNPHVSLGSHIRLPYTVEYRFSSGDAEEVIPETIEYPLQLNAALEVRGRQALQARLNIDVAYEWWSKGKNTFVSDYLDSRFDDAIVMKTAIEHIFFNKIPFQVGLQYRTAYQERSDTRTLISLGAGILGSGWRLDVAAAFSKLKYTFPDLFDDQLYGGDRSNSPTDDVEERYFFAMLTLRANLR